MATDVSLRLALLGRKDTESGLRSTGDAVANIGTQASRSSSIASTALGKLGSLGATVARGLATSAAAVTAVGAAATVSLVKTGIAYNDLEQKSKAAFKTILGSEQAATDMMGSIREFGKTSPFPRQAFISATQQLLGFGYKAEDIIPILKRINDTTAAVGGNAETIGTLSDVFAKIKVNGKISGEEINRLGAVGINAMEAISDSSGLTGKALQKAISKGTIGSEMALSSLTKYMDTKFSGAAENVKQTWSGAMDRVKGAWRDLGSAIVEPFIQKGGGGAAVAWANGLADGLRKAANSAPGIISLLKGDYIGAGATNGWEEDSKQVDLLLKIGYDLREVWGVISGQIGKFNGNLDASVPILSAVEWGTRNLLKLVTGVVGVLDLIAHGDYTGNLSAAFGWEEDSKAVDFLLRVRDGFIGIFNVVANGDYTGKLASAFGWEEDSKAVDVLFRIRDAAMGLADAVRNFDFSNMQASLGSIGQSLQTLWPAFTAFHDALPSVATLGGVAGDALTVLAGVLKLAADHVDLLIKAAPYLAAAYVAWAAGSRIVAAGVAITNTRMILGTATTWLNIAANRAHTAALLQNAAAIRGVSVAELQAQVSQRVTLAQRAALTLASWREVAGLVAQRVATIASSVATKAAAAGQWLLNAALSANPIGLVIVAVAALVAGLVWFFTKTEIGRKAWDGLTAGLQVGWGWLQKAAGAVFDLWMKFSPLGIIITQVKNNWDSITGAIGSFIDKIKSAYDWVKKLGDRLQDSAIGKAIGAANSAAGSVLQGMFAGGGTFRGGRGPILVGEQGPELITPLSSGNVLTNAETMAVVNASPVSLARQDGGDDVAIPRQPVHVPVYLNGREIARAVYDDAGNQMARA